VRKNKKKQIEWFIGLMNFDFEKASSSEILDLIMNMQIAFGRPLHPDLLTPQSSVWNPEITLEILKHLREILMKFVVELKRKFREVKKLNDDGALMKLNDITDLQNLFEIKTNAKVTLSLENKPKLKRDPEKRDMWKVYWPDRTLENSPLHVVISPEGGDEAFLFSFALAVNEIPLSFLRNCPECRKWFFQFGKTRLFCSPQCRARRGMRQLRQLRKKRIFENGKGGLLPGEFKKTSSE
jgi:hypothetical protein